ncbi:MAG: YceI family protein [Chloroflexi bacterium]|nr:YceI family protein [Chloroflexota bacterium]
MATQTRSTWVLDPSHTTIEFAAKHMMIVTVKGRFSKFDVAVDFDEAHPEHSKIEARIDTASLDTKEPQRDAHLRSPDFLDVEHYPVLTFINRRIEPRGKGRFNIVGDLTIRDKTREIVLDTTLTAVLKDPWGGQRAGFSAEATLDRKDFGLLWNVALEAGGWLVSDTVRISLEGELVKKSA